ncbi:MAG: IS4 family transposase [Chloroflexi bacterium]|nr:IS4 family transposase [Chloroflexota bacterium]
MAAQNKAQKRAKKKKSSVRHTRAIQRDRSKRPLVAPPDEQIRQRLAELLRPAIAAQKAYYRQLGLRERTLTLSVVVAIIVSLIWRQIGGGGTEIACLLGREGLLWVPVLVVSQQAVSERLRTFPPVLFLRILEHLWPVLQARWQARQRPLPPVLAWAQERYSAVLAADGSTLDALLRRVGLLRDCEQHPLAGKMLAVLDLCSWLPRAIWYEPDAAAHDQRFWSRIQTAVPAGALLLVDLGFTNFAIFAQLTTVTFITRAKSNLVYQVKKVYQRTDQVQDLRVWIGTGEDRQLVRLVKVLYQGTWYAYLTNELDPVILPAPYVAALYHQRWRIEDAYAIAKRLLGLAYFWNGSQRGVELQLWGTWMLYGILVDLTDAVAEALDCPFVQLSLETVYRGLYLYYFGQAVRRHEATDPVAYLAANASDLRIIKRDCQRFAATRLPLTVAAGP